MTTPTGILFDDPQAKPLSSAGQFQSGCYALFYVTGGTTPANVYADAFLQTPLTQVPGAAQPSCTADGTGLFNAIYMDPSVVYHIQMFTSGNVKFRDVDPYVPLPIPVEIANLISTVSGLQSQITSLTNAIAALQASYPWANITGVPAPLVSLGASTPPDTGSTFWRDDGTWAVPNQTGISVTQAASADVPSIGSSLTTVINAVPVSAGHTYAMLFEGDVVSVGSNGPLTTQLTPNSGALVAVGSGLNWVENDTAVDYDFIPGNAATGVSHSIHSGSSSYLRLRGRFEVPAGCTAVSLQMSTSTGTVTAKAGSYVTLLQIA